MFQCYEIVKYLRHAAMMKVKPGARLGMAAAIAGDVFSTPNNVRV